MSGKIYSGFAAASAVIGLFIETRCLMKKGLTWFSVVVAVVCCASCFVNLKIGSDADETFEAGCGQHIRTAFAATTLAEAESELGLAIAYVEENQLTEGRANGSPRGDLAHWYSNLQQARAHCKITPEPGREEIHLQAAQRQLLVPVVEDLSGPKFQLHIPGGIGKYPHYNLWTALMIVSSLGTISGLVGVLAAQFLMSD
jgi:hypothetical protein